MREQPRPRFNSPRATLTSSVFFNIQDPSLYYIRIVECRIARINLLLIYNDSCSIWRKQKYQRYWSPFLLVSLFIYLLLSENIAIAKYVQMNLPLPQKKQLLCDYLWHQSGAEKVNKSREYFFWRHKILYLIHPGHVTSGQLLSDLRVSDHDVAFVVFLFTSLIPGDMRGHFPMTTGPRIVVPFTNRQETGLGVVFKRCFVFTR